MDKNEIVAQIAKERRVEKMVQNISHSVSLSADLQDLAQIVYVIVLSYSDEVIVDLWEKGEMNFFLVRIIKTQLFSPRSNYRYLLHHWRVVDMDMTEMTMKYGKRGE